MLSVKIGKRRKQVTAQFISSKHKQHIINTRNGRATAFYAIRSHSLAMPLRFHGAQVSILDYLGHHRNRF